MITFILLVLLNLMLTAGIILCVIYIKKLRKQLPSEKQSSKAYTLLLDFKWYAGLFIEMIGAFIWGIIGGFYNLIAIGWTLLIEIPKFLFSKQ